MPPKIIYAVLARFVGKVNVIQGQNVVPKTDKLDIFALMAVGRVAEKVTSFVAPMKETLFGIVRMVPKSAAMENHTPIAAQRP